MWVGSTAPRWVSQSGHPVPVLGGLTFMVWESSGKDHVRTRKQPLGATARHPERDGPPALTVEGYRKKIGDASRH